MPPDPIDASYPATTYGHWIVLDGSVAVPTPHGLVLAYSPPDAIQIYTVLYFIHLGRIYVRNYNARHYGPSRLDGLARRFAEEVAKEGSDA